MAVSDGVSAFVPVAGNVMVRAAGTSTQLYTQVSIKKPKDIHTATHPAAKLERKNQEHERGEPEMDPAHVLAALDEEAEEDGEGE